MEPETMTIEIEKPTTDCSVTCRWFELYETGATWQDDRIVKREYTCRNKYICQDARRAALEHAAR